MNKKMKAALAGLAFVAGCEIGIAIQLLKMVHNFTIKENAMNETIPEDALDAALEAEEESAEEAEESAEEPTAEAEENSAEG